MNAANNEEFRALVEELKASQSWADMDLMNTHLARMLGIRDRTLYRWLAGDTKVPLTAVILLRMILKKKA
jgi:DNA-binding transcriptional regulator YiaG